MPFRIHALILMFVLSAAGLCEAGYRITFTPRVSVTPEYSDNLFTSNEDKANDLITVVSPGFTAEIAERTHALSLSYDLGYSCYDKFTEFNTLRHNAKISGWYGFSKHTRLDFQNMFLLTEEAVTKVEEEKAPGESVNPLDQPKKHLAEKETVRQTREAHYTDTANLLFTHRFGEADLLNVKYAYSILENDDPDVEDKKTHNPSADVTYWVIPEKMNVKTGMSFTRNEYSGTSESSPYWEEITNPSVGMGWWFKPREFGIEASYSYTEGTYLDRSVGLNKWYKSGKPSVSVFYNSLPYHVNMEANLTLTEAEYFDAADDFENWYGKIKLSKKLTDKFEVFVQYAHTVMDFKGEGEDYSVYDPSAGISYMLAEDLPLSFSLGYFYREREISSNEAALSVNGNIGKTWSFSRYGSVNFSTASGYDEDFFGAERLGFGVWYDAKSTAKYAFSKYLSSDIFGTYRRDKYVDLETTRDDETKELGSGITFQKEWWLIRFDYTYRTLDSTLSENSYEENRIRFQIMLTPPRPIRLNE